MRGTNARGWRLPCMIVACNARLVVVEWTSWPCTDLSASLKLKKSRVKSVVSIGFLPGFCEWRC